MFLIILVIFFTLLTCLFILLTPTTGGRYIILPKKAEPVLEDMKKYTGIKTNAELVARSLAVYEILLKAESEGGQIQIYKYNQPLESVLIR